METPAVVLTLLVCHHSVPVCNKGLYVGASLYVKIYGQASTAVQYYLYQTHLLQLEQIFQKGSLNLKAA